MNLESIDRHIATGTAREAAAPASHKTMSMWAALPQKITPAWPPTTTTKPPPRRRLIVVHNTQQQEIGGLRQAVVAALKSNEPQQHRNPVNSETKAKPPPPLPSPPKKELIEEEQKQRQLSGSDVLMALQRASAKKIKQKRDAAAANLANRSRNNAAKDKNQGPSQFSNSRPLCIKQDWHDRLQVLERRLEELAHG